MLKLKNVSMQFRKRKVLVSALDHVDFSLEKGEFVTIVGKSGSGKTTLIQICGGMLTPSSGTVELFGKQITKMNDARRANLRNRHIGFVFQSFQLIDYLSVIDNVALPLTLARVPLECRRSLARKILDNIGLRLRCDHYPSELSAGERQRVAIARALIIEPEIIIADEPTGNLDRETAEIVLTMLTNINRNGVAIMLVTHDPTVAELGMRTVKLQQGKFV